ncbi:MAG: type IV secretion system DNA-binding domain-containing protein [Candidatus Acidiferrales bacterium]
MIQRALHSKNFIACLLAMGTGTLLFFEAPFPDDNLILRLIALRTPEVFAGLKYSYLVMLFTTPYITFSILLSGLYIFALKGHRRIAPAYLPLYPDPRLREQLFIVVGEVHNPRKPEPSETPRWLTIPERGLYTGIAILGAIGTGKTSCCMYPFAEQILAFKADDKKERIGGLVLEVKGDFCRKVKGILERHGRAEDYIEIGLHSEYCYNPLHNDLDAYALAYSIAALLNNLFGKGKEPFWQQAYTNLVKFIILLHKVAYDYVTLFDVYECAISPDLVERRIQEAEKRLLQGVIISLTPEVYAKHIAQLKELGFVLDSGRRNYQAPESEKLRHALESLGVECSSDRFQNKTKEEIRKIEQLEAVRRWFDNDWRRIEPKLRTSIVEGISVFLSLFDDNPDVKRTFCPPKESYEGVTNAGREFRKPLPSFSWLIENGAVCALNFPIGMNPGLARALGVMMKLDFERAVLNRVPQMEAHPETYFRQVFFLCDEYHHFATVGENEPTGDEKFFSLSRQPKCIPIVATQSISSLKSSLPGDAWRTLLQTFRTKIFLALSDEFSARAAADLCGREDQLKVSYNISESGHDARVSWLTGRNLSDKANISASKSYHSQIDYRFDTKIFTELKNAESITIAYDGFNPMPPTLCYLKPYYNDPNKSYFRQVADGEL